MTDCRSRTACGSGSVLQPRACRAQRRQTACSRWPSALPWVKLMATGRRPSPSRVASETHFPLARVLECPRQSWLDQDDGRTGPDHSSDLVSGTGIPQVGPCDCQGSVTMCPFLTLLLTTLSWSPKCGRMELGTELSSGTDSSRWFVRRRSARNAQAAALSRSVSGAGGGSANACGDLVVASQGGCS